MRAASWVVARGLAQPGSGVSNTKLEPKRINSYVIYSSTVFKSLLLYGDLISMK